MILFLGHLSIINAQDKDLWAIDTKKNKDFLISKNNYETYFRVPIKKFPDILPRDSIFFRSNRFSPDSGYIGGFLNYVSIENDSLFLRLDMFSCFAPGKIHESEYSISVRDIQEIYLQRSYNKSLENIWVYGGLIGVISLISSPLFYFNENKPTGLSIFSLGVVSISASFISFDLLKEFREFKKPRYKFEIR